MTRTTEDWIAMARALRNIETMIRAQTEMISRVFKQQEEEIERLERKLADKEFTNT